MKFVIGIKLNAEDKAMGEKLVSSLSDKAQKGYNETISLDVYKKLDGSIFAKYNGGTYKADSESDLEKYLISLAADEEKKHLTDAEASELASNLDWGNPHEDPEDIKDSLRTNWESKIDDESVDLVYEAMCRIWDDRHEQD